METTPRELTLQPGLRVHMIGVGGVGMSALAAILAGRGLSVSGSDRCESPRLDALRALGVRVSVPQVAGGAAGADVVVRSAAIAESNPELADARARGLPVFERADLLAEIVRGLHKVAVAGTHGKTTTTAMLGTILLECGRDATVIVGGDAANLEGKNYHVGPEPLAVFEACESDSTFLRYGPCSEVITNVEADHLDQHGDFAGLCRAFEQFVALVPDDGFLAYGAESEVLAEMARRARGERISFGLGGRFMFGADRIQLRPFGATFRLLIEGRPAGEVELRVPGEHNVRNALAALAAATRLEVGVGQAAEALGEFRGVGRRFELLGKLGEAPVIDDYAHHPTEVSATLAAARRGWPDRRVAAIFQPHLFSRTRDFMAQFAAALAQADVVIVTEIYAAREDPIEGVRGQDLAAAVAELAPAAEVRFIPSREEIVAAVRELARPGDLILTLGAGDIRQVGEELAWR
ncbi:MAG: UDP-N-acetylmuramate--L-alanine ligase [Armatimonadota bacterium]